MQLSQDLSARVEVDFAPLPSHGSGSDPEQDQPVSPEWETEIRMTGDLQHKRSIASSMGQRVGRRTLQRHYTKQEGRELNISGVGWTVTTINALNGHLRIE